MKYRDIVDVAVVVVVGALVVGAAGRLFVWRKMTPWGDDWALRAWIHVDVDESEQVSCAWRYLGERAWRDATSRRWEGRIRYVELFPVIDLSVDHNTPEMPGPMQRDEPIEVLLTVDGEERSARGSVRESGHYRIDAGALVSEPSLLGVPLYAWVPW